jgi:ubiquinone/menaquinone biosynthesis C-methylase UbiE
MSFHKRKTKPVRTSWEPVADWYNGWMGPAGSHHHRHYAIPAVLQLLDPQADEAILDLGAGQGVLAQFIAAAQARYTGVDASPRLLRYARSYHRQYGRFLLGDARHLRKIPELQPATFDAAVFLLSIQDMDPLDAVLRETASMLKPGGRAVLLLTHPCFRVPRQSGWGWDAGRKLRYRRVDRYLTPLHVPIKAYTGRRPGATRSFHRPLHVYVNSLAACGLLVDRMHEITTHHINSDEGRASADKVAEREIPLFLAVRAWKVER